MQVQDIGPYQCTCLWYVLIPNGTIGPIIYIYIHFNNNDTNLVSIPVQGQTND